MSVAAQTAQWSSQVSCFPCIVQDDTLWADEVNQKNADAISTDNDKDEDSVFYVNRDLQSNTAELPRLLGSDHDTKFEGFKPYSQ